jgi:hypothetical protein
MHKIHLTYAFYSCRHDAHLFCRAGSRRWNNQRKLVPKIGYCVKEPVPCVDKQFNLGAGG